MDIQVADLPYKFLQDNKDKRFVYLFGGAGSAKSWSLAQYFLLEKIRAEKDIGILCLRKTKPAVKTSCLPLIKHWLTKTEIPYNENKTEMTLSFRHNNFIKFDSIDDIEKKKSIEGINYVWLEEATEFRKNEIMQLNLRCRASNKNGLNQLYFTFNPVDPIGNAYLKNLSDNANTHISRVSGKHDSCVLRVTHTDNPFLSEEERNQIEELADQDDEYNKIYRLGQWATPTNIIYTNWDIVEEMPRRYDDIYWGLDFGYSSNPAALVELAFHGDKDLFLRERLYRTGLTNPQLIGKMETIITNPNQDIIADCAEPKSIQEIRNAGFNNIKPCKKGTDSVRFGINTVKSYNLHITADSTNLIKEIRGYKWKVDKDDEPLPEPLKFLDHALDAIRYACSFVKGVTKASLIVSEAGLEVEGDDDAMWQDMS